MEGIVLSLSCELVLDILHCCTSRNHCFLLGLVLDLVVSVLLVLSLIFLLLMFVVCVVGSLLELEWLLS